MFWTQRVPDSLRCMAEILEQNNVVTVRFLLKMKVFRVFVFCFLVVVVCFCFVFFFAVGKSIYPDAGAHCLGLNFLEISLLLLSEQKL